MMKYELIQYRFLGGALLGAIAQSPISQKWGRRAATATGAAFVVIFSALVAGSVNIAMLLAARTLTGFGAGMLISNTPVYMSEISPAHTRGILVSSQGIAVTGAYTVSSLIALGFHYVHAPYQWRLQYIVETGLGIILLVIVYFIPESPRWLAVCYH